MPNILIHLHLYYLEQTAMLLEKLSVVKNGNICDLFVTMSGENADKNPEVAQQVYAVFPAAKIIIVKNIGADIFPFICVLNRVNLSDYDLMVKVHTKRRVAHRFQYLQTGYFVSSGYRWRDALLSFLKPENFAKIIPAFAKNQQLGMVADYRVILRHPIRSAETSALTKQFMRTRCGGVWGGGNNLSGGNDVYRARKSNAGSKGFGVDRK